MKFTKYAVILDLLINAVFASECIDKTLSYYSKKHQDNSRCPNAKISISNITNDSYHYIISYLGSAEIFSLLSSNKYLNKVIKKWIEIFISPKLAFSNSKLNLKFYSFLISTFPGIESIKDKRVNNLLNLAKNENFGSQNICQSSSKETKYALLAIIEILLNDFEETERATASFGENIRIALIWASKNGLIDVLRLLIENGANVNVSDNYEYSPLIWASIKGHTEIARLLIENGANFYFVDRFECIPLILASKKGHAEIVSLLIEKGANVNVFDKDKCTPLNYASENGHTEIVEILLENGVHVNACDRFESTPLLDATLFGYVEIVRSLLENSANVNVVDLYGRTPLINASLHGDVEIVKLLLEKGANIHAVDRYDRTPLKCALDNGYCEIAAVLIVNGAKEFSNELFYIIRKYFL